MKNTISILLIFSLAFIFFACNNKKIEIQRKDYSIKNEDESTWCLLRDYFCVRQK